MVERRCRLVEDAVHGKLQGMGVAGPPLARFPSWPVEKCAFYPRSRLERSVAALVRHLIDSATLIRALSLDAVDVAYLGRGSRPSRNVSRWALGPLSRPAASWQLSAKLGSPGSVATATEGIATFVELLVASS
jgi:hypothetical protein